MAVTSIGTPVNTHSATGSVTGAWGTGQSRSTGNLLVAVISAGASTSVTTMGASGGWAYQFEVPNSATAHVRVAIWTKAATGADAAPTFTSTETGTAGGMDCMLFELTGVYSITPVDVLGQYASGSTAGTLSAMTATTGAAVSEAGEYAISVFAQNAAAGSLTWTDSGTGTFTTLLSGNGASTVLQTYIGVRAAPSSGAALNDAGHFSVNTTAYGAGLVMVFNVATVTAIEAFANNASGTVTTGGTAAPAAGTTEAWTVTATGAFPVAKTSLVFHVVDPALPSEKFLVTVAPGGTGAGQSWTVTRGAEGTTPVAHATGFTIVQSVTAGVLAQLNQVQWLNVVTMFGADPTGVTDCASAVQAAVNAAIAANGGVVYYPPGTYKQASTVTANTASPVWIKGDGWEVATVMFTGTGDCFRLFNSGSYSGEIHAGGITGIAIDGTGAGAGSSGVHVGDLLQFTFNLCVRYFQGAGSKGVWLDNQYFWMEQMQGLIFAGVNTSGVVFDQAAGAATGSSGSFERCALQIYLETGNPAYDGVVLQNGAFIANGDLTIRGNCTSSASVQTSAVLRLTGSTPVGVTSVTNSGIVWSRLDIGVELNAGLANGAYTIFFGGSVNTIDHCYGLLDFGAAGTFRASNSTGAGQFLYQGYIRGDGGLSAYEISGQIQTTNLWLFSALGNSQVNASNASNNPIYQNSYDTNTYNMGVLTVVLASPYTSASAAGAQNVTGMTAHLGIGKYHLHAWIPYVGAGTVGSTQTFAWTFGGTVTAAAVTWQFKTVAYTAPVGGAAITTSSGLSPTVTSTQTLLEFEGTVTASVAGTLQLQNTNTTSADRITIPVGAFLELIPVG